MRLNGQEGEFASRLPNERLPRRAKGSPAKSKAPNRMAGQIRSGGVFVRADFECPAATLDGRRLQNCLQ
jgi:hypothetical protein